MDLPRATSIEDLRWPARYVNLGLSRCHRSGLASIDLLLLSSGLTLTSSLAAGSMHVLVVSLLVLSFVRREGRYLLFVGVDGSSACATVVIIAFHPSLLYGRSLHACFYRIWASHSHHYCEPGPIFRALVSSTNSLWSTSFGHDFQDFTPWAAILRMGVRLERVCSPWAP